MLFRDKDNIEKLGMQTMVLIQGAAVPFTKVKKITQPFSTNLKRNCAVTQVLIN